MAAIYTLYTRPRATLVFIKDGRKTDTGQPILREANYMFVEVAKGLSFVEPVSMKSNSDNGLQADFDVVDIQIVDRDAAIPINQQENSKTGPYGVQFFGDV
jgi:hypothetical protein